MITNFASDCCTSPTVDRSSLWLDRLNSHREFGRHTSEANTDKAERVPINELLDFFQLSIQVSNTTVWIWTPIQISTTHQIIIWLLLLGLQKVGCFVHIDLLSSIKFRNGSDNTRIRWIDISKVCWLS